MGQVILCPGQGSQKPGMLAPWISDAAAHRALERFSEAAGLDMEHLGCQASAEELRPTEVAQPLTVAVSLLSAQVSGVGVDEASVVAGHSLGYLTALAVAGALSAAQAVGLARERGLAMARCSQDNPGSMVALVGGEHEAVLGAIERAGAVAANINGSRQVVASGTAEQLAAIEAPAGTRAVPLNVAGAFHSPAMAGAVDALEPSVRSLADEAALEGRRTCCAVVDDATGQVWPAGSEAAGLIARVAPKILEPVRWDLVHESLLGTGVSEGVELAPAGTLAGLARRDMRGVNLTALQEP